MWDGKNLMLLLAAVGLCASPALSLYDSGSFVVELTPANFDARVLGSNEIWLVEFYAPWCGHCKNLVPEYSKAARALKGVARVGAVNADEHKSLSAQYGVSGFPTIKLFVDGKPSSYSGQRTAEAFVDAVLKAAKDRAYAALGKKQTSSNKGDVVTLTEDNFMKEVLDSEDLWLVEFYAPWCGHCKNLEPHWAKAATQLKGKVKVGAVDATVYHVLSSEYGVQGYPTIKVFPAGPKTAGSAEEYSGGRSADDIVSYALDKLAESAPTPEVYELVSEEALSACTGQPLCVVAVLPHILDCDAACRNGYLGVLAGLAHKYRAKQWGWVWAGAGSQPDVEAALELGGFGYPALAVLNAKKLKFATLRGSFSEKGIDEFLRDLSFGRGQTAPVRGAAIPAAETIAPWDGQDGTPPPEEDIDLSDVQLDKDEL